ncbi:uncharacterized protein Nost [Euwallacea fornicatus]|uniref:uncharacterized protein Nost n=1 Tax=Euwallacea fornicatus TaxID=995702 RepID=UPI00338F17AD
MKKFCNKIAKKDWRVTIPNINSSIFRRSPNCDEDKTSKRSSGFYDFHEAQVEFDKGRSLPNSIYVESDSSSTSSDTGNEDQEFVDAQDKTPNREIYMDMEELKNIDKNNSKFEYDVPKISFKFTQKQENIYENEANLSDEPVLLKHTRRSEIQIVLEQPNESKDDTLKDEDIEEALEELDNASIKSSQSEKLVSQCEEKVSAVTIRTLTKSGSDPNIAVRSEEDESFYKVPRNLNPHHRLSQSLSDFDLENMNLEILPNSSNHSSIEHISCSQVDIARKKLAEYNMRNSSPNFSEKMDYCQARSKLPVRFRRTTLLKRPRRALDSWNNFKSKMSNMITEQAAHQRVGAFVDRDKVAMNIEEMYKNSKTKCKKVLQNTGKIISTKLNQGRRKSETPERDIVKNNSKSSLTKHWKLKASDIEYKFNMNGNEEGHDVSDKVSDSDCSPMSKFGSEFSDDKSKEEEFDFSTIKSTFKKKLAYVSEGQNGFEELRRYVKHGSDFCKELATILHERSEAETQYAKSLSKLSVKLSRACSNGVGGLNEAWKAVAVELEAKAEAHRIAGNALLEETAKPLRTLTESQHRTRKQCETAVEKAARLLAEFRTAEAKGKKQSHTCARDNEKLQDAAVIDTTKFGKQTLSKSASLIQLAHRQNSADKENAKLVCKKKKAEDAVKKADIEYYTLCVRAERARLEWESSVLKGVNTFQLLEEERLNNLKLVLTSYLRHIDELQPRIIEATERLKLPLEAADPSKDLITIQNLRQTSQQISEQLLPDFYCEHITLAMNRERRKQALIKLLHLIRQDIERERKSKNGVENLSKALKQTPNFGNEDSQQSVVEKLYHMKSMLTYLEGARYKVQSALAELDSRPRTGHPLAPHIIITRDKSGLQQSVLKVPQWLREEFFETDRSPLSEKSLKSEKSDNSDSHINDVEDHVLHDWTLRGAADGNSNQPESDFDEFSSQCSSTDQVADTENVHPIAKCKAIYAYKPNLPDELLLSPGDILKVYRQQDDGWWLGECNGNVGIFPATYVEIVPA